MDLLKVNNMERIYLIIAFTFICSTIYLSISNYLLKSQYKVVKITESSDKKALKEAIKSGEMIYGVEVQNNLSLKIN